MERIIFTLPKLTFDLPHTKGGEGSGVRFIISLPAAAPISKKLEPKKQPRVPTDIRVLVVDDDEPFRRWLSKYLLSEGVFVQLATNGKEALKLIEESDFDIVLSDIKMPEMDGYELGRWLQENRPEYLEKFVLVTGMIEKDVEDFCDENNRKYLTKPVEREDILEMIQTVVG
ncbi:MAG: response regulator [Nitrospinota bacterium]